MSGENKFKCRDCNKSFKYKDSLRRHFLPSIKCKHCDDKISGHDYNEHKKICGIRCQLCDKVYKRQYYFVHRLRVHGPKIYNCEKCKEAFRWIHQLRSHSCTIEKKEWDTTEKYNDEDILLEEELKQTDHFKTIQDSTLDDEDERSEGFFATEEEIKQRNDNTKIETLEHEPVECEKCKNGFVMKESLIEHLLPSIICNDCDRKISEHDKNTHKSNCRLKRGICNNKSKKELKLQHCHEINNEVNIKTIIQDQNCEDENAAWVLVNLNDEQEYVIPETEPDKDEFSDHFDEKNLNSIKNDSEKATDSEIKEHKSINLVTNKHYLGESCRTQKDNIFKCDDCNKSFKFKDSLRRHFVPSIKCKHCDDKISGHDYNEHKKNCGIRCQICDKVYKRQYYFVHRLRVHGPKIYECNKCKRNFRWDYQLKNHECSSNPAKKLVS